MRKITNKDLVKELMWCKLNNELSQEMVDMFNILIDSVATRKGYSYSKYKHLEDMKAYAILTLCRTWYKMNLKKSANAYAFYNTIIHSAFLQYLNRERKEREICDNITKYRCIWNDNEQ